MDQLEPQRPPEPVREGGQRRSHDAQEGHDNHDRHDGDSDLAVEELVLQRRQRDAGADEGEQEAQDGRHDVDNEPRPHVLGAKGEHGGQREEDAEGDEHEDTVRQAGRRAGGHRGDEAGSAGGEVDLRSPPVKSKGEVVREARIDMRSSLLSSRTHQDSARGQKKDRAPTCKEPRLVVPWSDRPAEGPMAQLSATAPVDGITFLSMPR